MGDRNIAMAFQSKKVQEIVKRSVWNLIRKYDDKNIEKDELINQSYICFHSLMKNFRHDDQIEDYNNLTDAALGYIAIYLPLRVEAYVWEICDIHRTKTGYRKQSSVEFDTNYHGGSINGQFERQMELDEVIDDALFSVTDNQRDLIIMEYFQELTPLEITTQLKVKPSTYRKRKHDSLKALHKVLKKEQQQLLQEVI